MTLVSLPRRGSGCSNFCYVVPGDHRGFGDRSKSATSQGHGMILLVQKPHRKRVCPVLLIEDRLHW